VLRSTTPPPEPAHFLVTRACLSILLQLDDQIAYECMKDFPLVQYAARYWVEHAKSGNALLQTEDMVKQLFDPRNPHFARWLSIWNMDYPPREYVQPTPLYHAALLNLCGVAKWLVNTCSQDINAYGGDYGTPLHAASSTGSLEVVQYLLMCNADDNQVSYDHTLFYVVSEGGQVLVPGLLEVGADINSRDKKGRTPLHVIEQGGEDVALLLLEHGADPAVRDDNGQTPLHVAS